MKIGRSKTPADTENSDKDYNISSKGNIPERGREREVHRRVSLRASNSASQSWEAVRNRRGSARTSRAIEVVQRRRRPPVRFRNLQETVHLMRSNPHARKAIPFQSFSFKRKCLKPLQGKVSERLREVLRGFALCLRALERQSMGEENEARPHVPTSSGTPACPPPLS